MLISALAGLAVLCGVGLAANIARGPKDAPLKRNGAWNAADESRLWEAIWSLEDEEMDERMAQ